VKNYVNSHYLLGPLFCPPMIHSRMYAEQFLSWMLSASQRLRKLTTS
jgi:hypothetical protein